MVGLKKIRYIVWLIQTMVMLLCTITRVGDQEYRWGGLEPVLIYIFICLYIQVKDISSDIGNFFDNTCTVFS